MNTTAHPSDAHASGPSGGGGGRAVSIHEPFTTAERMQQLSAIDNDIASLLQHTSDAMKSIVHPPETDANQAITANAASAFSSIQDEFINTLDRIDKQLKRQIYALEEAGIITLRAASDALPTENDVGPGGRAKVVAALLDPDGVGRYGAFDVGRLNMASSTVERDMEAEQWRRAREHLARVVENRSGGGDGGDRMQE
ncbi:mediator complex protein-domain-containing protein [Bombardia bombarda]|uniref:Mediator of RNA polymerase II transcription subunit 11 n=1 Tax=Bombardia bombarda TaxID=252184 RepID=A0AA40CEX9_9PEZI|nr:mediator complex protein-domain-containing protein [Bombardia bombarda]